MNTSISKGFCNSSGEGQSMGGMEHRLAFQISLLAQFLRVTRKREFRKSGRWFLLPPSLPRKVSAFLFPIVLYKAN